MLDFRCKRAGAEVLDRRRGDGTRVVVNLDQATMPEDLSALLRVFANTTNADATTEAAGQSFVQELYLVPAKTPGTSGEHQHPFNLRVVLRRILRLRSGKRTGHRDDRAGRHR